MPILHRNLGLRSQSGQAYGSELALDGNAEISLINSIRTIRTSLNRVSHVVLVSQMLCCMALVAHA